MPYTWQQKSTKVDLINYRVFTKKKTLENLIVDDHLHVNSYNKKLGADLSLHCSVRGSIVYRNVHFKLSITTGTSIILLQPCSRSGHPGRKKTCDRGTYHHAVSFHAVTNHHWNYTQCCKINCDHTIIVQCQQQ